jgi:hypothetical protein
MNRQRGRAPRVEREGEAESGCGPQIALSSPVLSHPILSCFISSLPSSYRAKGQEEGEVRPARTRGRRRVLGTTRFCRASWIEGTVHSVLAGGRESARA